MKKFLALVMAMLMILAMGTVAFADENEQPAAWNGTYTATDKTTFSEITKTYTSENNVVVNETLTFTPTAKKDNPDGGNANLTVANLVVTSLNPGTLTVTIPSLSKVGTYEWTIKENAGSTAGVTYSNAEVHVIALVEYDNVNHKLVLAKTTSYIKKIDGSKASEFNNTFKSGSFSVAKDVIGNMANENDVFTIKVTLTSTVPIGTNLTVCGETVVPSAWTENKEQKTWTYTKTLEISDKDGAQSFSDIPTGVTVTVEETNAGDYDRVGIYSGKYTVADTTVAGTEFKKLTVEDTTSDEITAVNSKTSTIETGIFMDNAPYMMIMALVVLAGAAMLLKKRAYND